MGIQPVATNEDGNAEAMNSSLMTLFIDYYKSCGTSSLIKNMPLFINKLYNIPEHMLC